MKYEHKTTSTNEKEKKTATTVKINFPQIELKKMQSFVLYPVHYDHEKEWDEDAYTLCWLKNTENNLLTATICIPTMQISNELII